MRDLRTDAAGPYAAHTQGRNSFAAGLAVCAMRSATPSDFGFYPLRTEQVAALCAVAATLVRFYGIALDAVRTHAEAALEDGYFGAESDDVRWDIARLEPSKAALQRSEAHAVGDRVAPAHCRARLKFPCPALHERSVKGEREDGATASDTGRDPRARAIAVGGCGRIVIDGCTGQRRSS